MKILKWVGITLILILLAAFSFALLKINDGKKRLKATFEVKPLPLIIQEDSLSLLEGEKLVSTLCKDCHGPDLGGKVFFNESGLGTIYAPNLTSGGKIKNYTNEDWVRSIRHGVSPEGSGLLVMPSKDYSNLYEEDLSAIITFMQSLPPVSREDGVTELTSFASFLLSVGAFGEAISAEVIDHQKPLEARPVEISAVERGRYLVDISGCRGCHGVELTGYTPPDPNSPVGPDITSKGSLGNWTFEQFQSFAETGIRPIKGDTIGVKFMPLVLINSISEMDQRALFEYLNSI